MTRARQGNHATPWFLVPLSSIHFHGPEKQQLPQSKVVLVILDTLATRSTAGEWQVLSDGNGKANLEKTASRVPIQSKRNTCSPGQPCEQCKGSLQHPGKVRPHGEHAEQGRGYTLEVTLWRLHSGGYALPCACLPSGNAAGRKRKHPEHILYLEEGTCDNHVQLPACLCKN